MSSDEYSESEHKGGNRFLNLMDDDVGSCDDNERDKLNEKNEPENVKKDVVPTGDRIKTVPSIPVNKPNKKNKNKSTKDEEDAEFNELMNEVESNKRIKREKILKKHEPYLSLNVAAELNDKYSEDSFCDAANIGRYPQQNKFISKRISWPQLHVPIFRVQSKKPLHYTISLTNYGEACAKVLDQEPHNFFEILHSEPFNFGALILATRFAFYKREFSDATDYVLRLTFIIQQVLLNTYSDTAQFTDNCFDSSGNPRQYFLEILNLIAVFSFRRGCYKTSITAWKMIIESFDSFNGKYAFGAAVPALFAGDADFLKRCLEKEKLFDGITLRYIPDYEVCYSILNESKDKNELYKTIRRYLYVFGFAEMDENAPGILQLLLGALKKRIEPYIKDKVFTPSNQTPLMDDKSSKVYSFWATYKKEIQPFDIVEELFLPTDS